MYGPKQAEKKNTAIVAFCSKSGMLHLVAEEHPLANEISTRDYRPF